MRSITLIFVSSRRVRLRSDAVRAQLGSDPELSAISSGDYHDENDELVDVGSTRSGD